MTVMCNKKYKMVQKLVLWGVSFTICLHFFMTVVHCAVACPTGYHKCSNGYCSPNEKFCFKFWDPSFSSEERGMDLLSKLKLDEKISLMGFESPEVSRLGVPAYNWGTECLHGYVNYPPEAIGNKGYATIFPQSIGLSATFNPKLIKEMAHVIGTEARALNNYYRKIGLVGIHTGINCWAPNLNIARDPRWGRVQETYGEDPFLSGQITKAFVSGLQGNHSRYLQAIATCKHFDAYSLDNITDVTDRHHFNAIVSERDLRTTYLPAFKACIQESKGRSVMCSYNSINGVPACGNARFLKQILLEEFKFDGYVVGDCGAIQNIFETHHFVDSEEKAVATALINGTDLDCGEAYQRSLNNSLSMHFITEKLIDASLLKTLKARFDLGLFDLDTVNPYGQIALSEANSDKHRALAREVARQSIVLLKNEKNVLPIKPSEALDAIAIIGPNAHSYQALLGNYHGFTDNNVTALDGIMKKLKELKMSTKVYFSNGCQDIYCKDKSLFSESVDIASKSDLILLFLGIDTKIEEEIQDRTFISLPGYQENLIQTLQEQFPNKPVILILMNGGPISCNWSAKNVDTILEAYYPGEEGGNAIADILFGDTNPAGRLSVTYYQSLSQVPPYTSMEMSGRTYRYFAGEPQWRFGDGISYSTFVYKNLSLTSHQIKPCETIQLKVTVYNEGPYSGDEVIQVYISHRNAKVPAPLLSLCSFKRVFIKNGQYETITLSILPEIMSVVLENNQQVIEGDSHFDVYVGGNQPTSKMRGANHLKASFSVQGDTVPLSRC